MSKSNSKDKLGSNFLDSMMKESDSYSSMEMIESLVEKGLTLENIPLQPLYLALKNLSPNQVGEYLVRLSKGQRQLIQDLDLWFKDDLDPDEFDFWVQSYAQCMDDDVRGEFASGVSFLLFLKGRFNIWTFDYDDPSYPDHDNYFLTDDGLLLFEFHEDYSYISEVRALIREIYANMGVEHAYTWLFKMVSDGALNVVEDEYQLKKGRLSEAGFVDYFDALEIDNPFVNRAVMENILKKKEKISVGVSSFSKSQVLPKKALIPFKESFSSFDEELSKVEDDKRSSYLQFNFLRLVNGNVALRGSFKDGAVAINRAGEKTKDALLLGFDYLKEYAFKNGIITLEEGQSLFDIYDFTEIFKIGNSLIRFLQADLKKALRQSALEDQSAFLGKTLNEYIDYCFDIPVSYVDLSQNAPQRISSFAIYDKWEKQGRFIIDLLPFVQGLYQNFLPLRTEGRIQDHFYMNYNVDDIDVETIFISSFANFQLLNSGLLKQEVLNKGKLGLTLDEFISFTRSCLDSKGDLLDNISVDIIAFKKSFGLDELDGFEIYLLGLLKEQLEGYDYEFLEEGDFAHVGGPIIFKRPEDFN
ncbi:MAG: DUF6178 family protein [Bacteriovoracaceae bacterium]|nr:DUF6178 family protein [Bacteriovoracaceae bacterium]